MSLLTGVPFVGGAIGTAYDYGKGIFAPKIKDMSAYNQLSLFGRMPEDFEDEKISLTSFTENDPTNVNNMFKDAYNNYLMDAPPNPMTFDEFKSLYLDRAEAYNNIVNVGDM